MTWLYIPNIEPSHSAPEPEGSSSASNLHDPERAASLTWRGKHMQPAHWSRAWKRDSWLRRLSGLTLPPSTLDRGADAFIASLPEIHAKRTASPENGSEQLAPASSPPRSFASPTSAGLIVSSARTSQGMRTDSLRPSSRHWSDWATALRLEYSARPESEQDIDASGCSSWPTPRTITGGGESAERKKELGRMGAGGGDLQAAVEMWATPAAQRFEAKDQERMLTRQAECKAKGASGNGFGLTLDNQVQIWAGKHWASPCARDWRGSGPETVRADGKSRMDMLDYQAERGFQSLHRAQPIDGGPTSSPERRTLNPLFVEWLMGWPIGWTDCACAEMAFTRWQQDMRGLLWTLCSRTPRQATLL